MIVQTSQQPVTIRHVGGQTGACRLLSSSSLFEGHKEIRILHAGVQYVLRITKEQKLVLTK
jgi:hemin uptake protein HemP